MTVSVSELLKEYNQAILDLAYYKSSFESLKGVIAELEQQNADMAAYINAQEGV